MDPDDDRERLEARLAEEPEDVELWKVYADHLQRDGDPRGELIVLQMAADAERTAAPKKAGKAELAARKYLAKLAAKLVGPLGAMGDKLTWRFGFVHRAAFDARTGDPAASLDQLLAHPSGKFVAEIAIRYENPDPRFELAVDALARHRPRALQALDLYANATIDLDGSWPHLARLRRIALIGVELQLAGLALPAARRASFAAIVLSPTSMRAIATAPWPALERLEVRLGSRAPFSPFEDIVPLLRRTDLPALTHLKLRNSPFAGAILRELAMRPLGAQLQVIDLSHGQLTPQDVSFVAERKHVFRELRELWLPVSATSADNGKQLAGIAKHLVPDSKAPLDTLERELVASPGGIRYETIHE